MEQPEVGANAHSEGGLSPALEQFTRHPFRELPIEWVASAEARPGSLFDVDAARGWFAIIDAVRADELCTYQIPLTGQSSTSNAALETPLTLFSSYSYLGLNGHPRITAAAQSAMERYGTSAGGVRMLTGTLELHLELEDALATFLRRPAAATFASGYDANIAAVNALFGSADLVLLDQHAHRSLHDAVVMAGCERKRFRHSDLEHLEALLVEGRSRPDRRVLVAIDALYSMDGDEAPLREIVELKDRYGAFLLVDESHSIGALGPTGRGICETQGVDPGRIDITTGSLGKAIPSSGGFVAGSAALKVFLQFGSAPYFFSGALSPPNAAAILASLRVMDDEPDHLDRLRTNTEALHALLASCGFDTGASSAYIVPLILGDEWRAFRWARTLLDDRIAVSAVPYPAVPLGKSRLRLCANAAHTPRDLQALSAALAACVASERGPGADG